jgi:hypothetical protein
MLDFATDTNWIHSTGCRNASSCHLIVKKSCFQLDPAVAKA